MWSKGCSQLCPVEFGFESLRKASAEFGGVAPGLRWHLTGLCCNLFIYSVATGEEELPGRKPRDLCAKMKKTSGSVRAEQDFRFRAHCQSPKYMLGLDFYFFFSY